MDFKIKTAVISALFFILLGFNSATFAWPAKISGISDDGLNKAHLVLDDSTFEAEPIDPELLVEEIMYFWELGNERIERTENENIIIVVGSTGVGKSTIVQFIGNETNSLYADKNDGTSSFYIRDDSGKVSDPGDLISKTFLPELVEDPTIGTAFYDMPGFDDTRNQTVEIANAFYIKSVIEAAKSIKIVVVIKHSTLSDKPTYKAWITNFLKLVKNVSKYNPSISLVCNQVPASQEIPDSDFYGDIREFLLNKDVIDSLDPEFQTDASTLFNHLLDNSETSNPTFLGLMRTPNIKGYLSVLPDYIEARKNLKHLVYNNTSYVQKLDLDFGYSLSLEAENLIGDITKGISKKVKAILTTFSEILIPILQNTSNGLVINADNSAIYAILTNVKDSNYEKCQNQVNLHHLEYFTEIDENLKKFSGDLYENLQADIDSNVVYLDFLRDAKESMVDENIAPIEWITPLLTIMPALSNHINTSVTPAISTNIDDTIITAYPIIIKDIKDTFAKINTTGETSIIDLETRVIKLINSKYPKCDEEVGLSPLIYMTEIATNILSFGGSSSEEINEKLNVESGKLTYLQTTIGLPITFDPRTWTKALKNGPSEIFTFIDNEVAPKIFENIITAFSFVSKAVRIQFENEVTSINDVGEKLLVIQNWMTKLETTKNNLDAKLNEIESTLSGFIITFNTQLLALGDSLNPAILAHFNSLAHLLEEVGNISWQRTDVWTKDLWKSPLLLIDAGILSELKWNKFVTSLFDELSQYNIQIEGKGDLLDWASTDLPVTFSTFDSFWLKFTAEKISTIQNNDQDEIKAIVKDPTKMDSLNSLFAVLENTFTCPSASDGAILFEGMFVSLANALKCPGTSSAKKIMIMAYHTLYIDSDILSLESEIFFISPKWYTQSLKSVKLNGENGAPPPGKPGGTGGTDGDKGNSGTNAGNMYGIGLEFLGGSITYTVNGGNGGDGQDGQDGTDGTKGDYQSISQNNDNDCSAWSGGWIKLWKNPWSCPTGKNGDGQCKAPDGGVEVKLDGLAGKSGQNGGSGGPQGVGGSGGEVIIVGVSGPGTEKVEGSKGNDGRVGYTGQIGRNGSKGDTNVLTIDDAASGSGKWCKIIRQQYVPVAFDISNENRIVSRENQNSSFPRGIHQINNVTPESYLQQIKSFKAKANLSPYDNEFLRAVVQPFIKLINETPSIPK